MANPISALLDRCSHGFTIPQKVGLTMCAVVYVISPIDGLPLLPFDDWGVLILLGKVLLSPTLPRSGDGSEPAVLAKLSPEALPAKRRVRDGGGR